MTDRTAIADVPLVLDEVLREIRPHLSDDTSPWIRRVWQSLRGLQGRLEKRPERIGPPVSWVEAGAFDDSDPYKQ